MAFTVDIRGNASHLEKTLKSVKGSVAQLGSVATAGVAGLAALGAAGAAGIGAFIVSSSKAASNVESLTMQFETLLGGADAAGKRMEEITKFAESTPFEIAELAATSKLLQTMGGTLLATGEGLRMVGDAASVSGRPLEEVALHIGRVFGAITSGTSAGESVGRLVEIGLITGDVKRQFEALAASQKKGTAATLTGQQGMAKLREVFKSTDGAMARLAATTEGKLSAFADNISKLKVAFGTGFNDGLKVALDATNNFLPQIEGKFKEAGEVVGSAITQAVSGNTSELATLGALIGEIVFAGFKAVYLKGMDELIALPQNAASVALEQFRALAKDGELIGIKEGKQRAFDRGSLANPSSFAGWLQTAMEEIGQSQNLKTLQNSSMDRQAGRIAKNLGEKFNQELAVPMAGIFSKQSPSYSANSSFMQPATLSSAVTEGVLKAFVKQAPGAKFSN